MMMPRAFVLLALLSPALMPFAPVAAAEGPALPDMSVSPGDIRFSVFGVEVAVISQEYGYVTIEATVRNSGPGTSSGANVSFFDDGRFLALVPVRANLSASGPGNETRVEFSWYIKDTATGNHTIRVEASDPAGDADPSDNAAEKDIRILGPAPTLAIKLDTASKTASVTATTPDNVTMTGSVVVDHPPGPVEITLAASTDTGWACRLNWTSIIVTDLSPHGFSLAVIVPPGTRNSQVGQLTIAALAAMDGMSTTAQTKGIVWVDPYFCVTAHPDRTGATVGPAESALFRLEMRNTGNAVDSYELEVMDLQALERKGWTARLSCNSIPKVQPDERRKFTLELVPRQDWTPYKDERVRLDVKVSSLNADDFQVDVHATISLTVEQKGFFMPSVGLIGLVALLAVIVAAVAVRVRRSRTRRKTAADWDRELGLD